MPGDAEVAIPARVQVITPDLTALAFYDRAWRSWVDCYLLHRGTTTAMIDCAEPQQSQALITALRGVQVAPEAVGHLAFTHGHRDHIGGSGAFPAAKGILHSLDRQLVPDRSPPVGGLRILTDRDGQLDLGDLSLDYRLVGNHTPGSVVFWHAPSAALFCGDFLCWFNENLPAADGVVFDLDQLEHRLRRFVGWWTASPRFGDAAGFRRALLDLSRRWQPHFLCAGHGPVLRGDIAAFLGGLADLNPSPYSP
jgi:glyoxylase-like metal-dependent hydrolase (beta-lactamase superfamily II)